MHLRIKNIDFIVLEEPEENIKGGESSRKYAECLRVNLPDRCSF